jgi:hypothetical protein
MNRRFLLLPIFLLILVSGFAKTPENEKQLRAYQDTLRRLDSAIFRGKDHEKKIANQRFIDYLRKALNTEGAFEFGFDSLKTIARLTAPDNAFRIFNWNVPNDDGTYTYYGFLVVNQSKVVETKKGIKPKDKYVVYELVDRSDEIRNPEIAARLSPEKWYGALYYKVIKTNDKSKAYYTLLGWDGNNQLTWKKLIEVLSFDKQGNPIFGENRLFQRGARKSSYRVIFEFRAELVMTLHWEDDNKRIVFDHLAPEVAGAEGMYQFYSQTFSYDAFIWKKGKWQQEDDVKVANGKAPNDDKYIKPQGDQNPKPVPPPKPPGGK